jgi:predicted polyphosphate/ATP-dependent NAD kinase
MHSAVYAANPGSAGELARLFLQGKIARLREAEVMDLDETAYRQGSVSAQLYGYLKIPFQRRLVQNLKSATPPGEKAAAAAIACDVVDRMTTDCLYIIGPGTTTRTITEQLGLNKTLIGVDVILGKKVVTPDANETQLLALLAIERKAKIIVTPIGGQGYIFGRGNQQISPPVIRHVGKENIIVVSTPDKINSLRGDPLLVDTGDCKLDKMLTGHMRVVTGYNQQIVYRVAS